ncbi:hypothetical protein D3C81_1433540 [compost metagenome]
MLALIIVLGLLEHWHIDWSRRPDTFNPRAVALQLINIVEIDSVSRLQPPEMSSLLALFELNSRV